jgi:hypothetical protein
VIAVGTTDLGGVRQVALFFDARDEGRQKHPSQYRGFFDICVLLCREISSSLVAKVFARY